MQKFRVLVGILTIATLVMAAGPLPAVQAQAQGMDQINHIIVIYQENWSFDSLYGNFPGANGLANASATVAAGRQERPALRHPAPAAGHQQEARRAPTRASRPTCRWRPSMSRSTSPADQKTGDLVHRCYQEQYQIDGGKMDKFVAWSDAAGLVMGYYDATNMPEGKLAQQYTHGR